MHGAELSNSVLYDKPIFFKINVNINASCQGMLKNVLYVLFGTAASS